MYRLAVITAVLMLGGCIDLQRVGGHQYRVPHANLISQSNYPFFLPRSNDDGFIFVLNPSADLTEQRTVLVQDRATICARAKGGAAYVNATICASHRVGWRGRRWVRNGTDVFWTYSPETTSAPFVACHAMELAGHPGLCTATLPANDLALSISLEADEMPALDSTYTQAVALLQTWER